LVRAGEGALAVREALGDPHVQARALYALGLVHSDKNQLGKAAESFERALRHARTAGDRRAEADSLYFLGACTFYGPTPAGAAVPRWEQFLEESHASPALQAAASAGVGLSYALRGRFDEARAAFAQALEIYAQTGMSLHRAGTT